MSSPVRQRFRLPLPLEESRTPPVIWLSPLVCPVAVVTRIWATIQTSFYSVVRRRAWPHVHPELLERLCPFIRHANAASPIRFVICVARSVTATLRADPYPVFWGATLAVFHGRSSLAQPACSRFTLQTAARLRMGSPQVPDKRGHTFTAIAHTDRAAMGFASAERHVRDDGQSSEAVTDHVYSFHSVILPQGAMCCATT